jgi:hypothetical protein
MGMSEKLRRFLTTVRRLYKIELWEWVLLMVCMDSPVSTLRIMRMAYALKDLEIPPFSRLTFEPGKFAPYSLQIALTLSELELRNLIKCERRKVVKVLRRDRGVEWHEDRVCEVTESGFKLAKQIKRWARFKRAYIYVREVALLPIWILNALVYLEATPYLSQRYAPLPRHLKTVINPKCLE